LRKYKETIRYSIKDLKGLNPAVCTHLIPLKENHKPTIEHQRRLNSNLQEVVKKEIFKLLEVNIIYLISDSMWVISVHIMPKKGGGNCGEK
jgi:hypothetical protein